jgi:hypothetical protein
MTLSELFQFRLTSWNYESFPVCITGVSNSVSAYRSSPKLRKTTPKQRTVGGNSMSFGTARDSKWQNN